MDIDLNADLGEGFGPWRMGDDEALLEVLSSANIACGFHAGDPLIMERTVRIAGVRGVDIGAHVGFPDRQRMTHMSFHGALGNLAAADAALAGVLVRAVAAFDPSLIISSSSSVAIEGAAAGSGLRVATTFLADRAYDDQGLLVPRQLPNSVLHDEGEVLARVRRLLADGTVLTYSGKSIRMRPRSILVHGDTRGALNLARTLRSEIEAGGGRIVPISKQLA
jgi:5-oxoprolinase (ATP-hydrolysing) subunit A